MTLDVKPLNATVDRVKKWNAPTRYMAFAALGVLVLAVVQAIEGSNQLTAQGTWASALRVGAPILLAGLGGLFSERAGIVNIGLEGMMVAGMWFGAWAGWQYGPWQGVALGILGGAVFGLLHAVATVTFAVDQIVSGVAINILAPATMRFMSSVIYTPDTGGGVTQSPRIQSFVGTFDVPLLSDWFNTIADKEWFFVSDVFGILAGFTTGMSWLTLVVLALVPLSWWLLWRTAWGLRLRSVGENPWAAESLGVPVLRMKYWGVVISGAFAGLGGAYLVVVSQGVYREASTAGRGFIGLAALIFGNYNPFGVLAGAGVFGYSQALSLREGAVHALLLLVVVGLVLLAIVTILRKKYASAGIQLAFALAFFLWWAATDDIPNQIVTAVPYVITLFVLATATQRLRMPSADGIPYRKGEGH